jgi:hypothetical protein
MARRLRWGGARFGRVFAGWAVTLGVSTGFAPPAFADRAAIGHHHHQPPRAAAARTIMLRETGHLRLTSKHNFTLNERGRASGTIKGTIYVRLTAVSSSRVTVKLEIHRPGGSISGSGAGAYRRRGKTASFSGSMSIGHGTARYAHAHGSNLSFSGTIRESKHDAITVYVTGRVSD